MNPVSAIANAVGSVLGSIGGIISNAQVIRQIREQQNLVQHNQLPDWASPSEIVFRQNQLEAGRLERASSESQLVTAGLVLIIVIIIIGIVVIAVRKRR